MLRLIRIANSYDFVDRYSAFFDIVYDLERPTVTNHEQKTRSSATAEIVHNMTSLRRSRLFKVIDEYQSKART